MRATKPPAVQSRAEVDSPEWFSAIADNLRNLGYDASADHTGDGIICVVVTIDGYQLYFGTANENWGFDIYSGNGTNAEFNEDLTSEYALNPATQMTLSSETPDTWECAKVLAATVEIFRKDRGL